VKHNGRASSVAGTPAALAPLLGQAGSAAHAAQKTLSIEDREQSLLLRPSYDLATTLEIQRQQVGLAQYTEIGRLKLIVFGEPAAGAPTPPRDQTNVWGIRLDWMGDGPMLGISADGMHILVLGALTHPPRIPHPAWEPAHGAYLEYRYADGYKSATASRAELDKHGAVRDWKQIKADRPKKADMIDQKYSERSNCCWPNEAALRRGEGFIVFSPIMRLMFQNSRGFGVIKGGTNRADGTKFSLLVNPKNKLRGEPFPEGFFARGTFQIVQGPEV